MDRQFLKTLWHLRFEKMKKTEDASAWNYQELLNQVLVEWGSQSKSAEILTTLVREERAHGKLAEKLLDILKKYEG